jgi:23S rRNA (cytidine1920-2'-O)/16S rRNA (cytidine1409-2'-O)-methyltransferase
MDVSFISVRKIFPAIIDLLNDSGKIICLIKPQFEVARSDVGDGGIVKDPIKHQEVVRTINEFASQIGLVVKDVIDSPILGARGNKEFLSLYEREERS